MVHRAPQYTTSLIEPWTCGTCTNHSGIIQLRIFFVYKLHGKNFIRFDVASFRPTIPACHNPMKNPNFSFKVWHLVVHFQREPFTFSEVTRTSYKSLFMFNIIPKHCRLWPQSRPQPTCTFVMWHNFKVIHRIEVIAIGGQVVMYVSLCDICK